MSGNLPPSGNDRVRAANAHRVGAARTRRRPVGTRAWMPSVIVMVVVAFGVSSTSALAAVDSGIAPAQAISLPSGDGQYFCVGSTAGGQPMEPVSWLAGQDLAVTAACSGGQAISIGRSTSDGGSFTSAVGSYAIAGAGPSGYAVAQTFSAQASKVGPGKNAPGGLLGERSSTFSTRTLSRSKTHRIIANQ